MRRLNNIALFLLASASSVTQAELTEIQWESAGRFEKTSVLPPGKFTELCGRLSKGQKVAWSFKSNEPLNFNIHYHEGENVTYPVKQTGSTAAEGTLDVSQSQQYCWMWSNKGATPASVSVLLLR